MFDRLPQDPDSWMDWTWQDIAPYYAALRDRPLDRDSLVGFLHDWSLIDKTIDELSNRLFDAKSGNTADASIEARYNAFLDGIYPQAIQADQVLKQKLLASGLEPEGFAVPLRNMRAEADLYRAANVPLLSDELKLSAEYDRLRGAQTVEWEGQELTLDQIRPVLLETDRSRREKAWRLSAERQLADRGAIADLWKKFLDLRLKLAANAGKESFEAFRWQQLLRFDYTPEDCERFGDAIAEAVVPAAARIYEKRRRLLGVDSLRPWDLDVDPLSRPPLRPFSDIQTLVNKSSAVIHQVDPALGGYFDTMVREQLLDLENRKNKAPGAYCNSYARSRRPFIFANAVGLHDDVMTLLHESGHAFHVFEAAHLPYFQQLMVPMEFAEVASMGMEHLAMAYLSADRGGFYGPEDAARAQISHLESDILLWPYIAVVDGFQRWVYAHPAEAALPAACDACWSQLWRRFMPGVDWSGLELEMATGWQRKQHIHTDPFYYVEYGLAQLGAVQIWRNAVQKDQAAAIADYRAALSLGGTALLPDLYRTAGARLAFDAATFREMIAFLESRIAQLEAVQS